MSKRTQAASASRATIVMKWASERAAGDVLVNAERSTSPELATWSVPIPDGLRWVFYDLSAKCTVLEAANGEGGADLHEGLGRVAWLRLRATHGLAKDELVIARFG